MRRRVWLVGLCVYALGAGIDFAYHLIDNLRSGDQAIEVYDIAVAIAAGLFWPIDIIAIALLTTR